MSGDGKILERASWTTDQGSGRSAPPGVRAIRVRIITCHLHLPVTGTSKGASYYGM